MCVTPCDLIDHHPLPGYSAGQATPTQQQAPVTTWNPPLPQSREIIDTCWPARKNFPLITSHYRPVLRGSEGEAPRHSALLHNPSPAVPRYSDPCLSCSSRSTVTTTLITALNHANANTPAQARPAKAPLPQAKAATHTQPLFASHSPLPASATCGQV